MSPASAYVQEASSQEKQVSAELGAGSIAHHYTELQPGLLRFLMGFGVGRDDAEDITHDTFLKSLRRPVSQRIDNVFHWLCTCAKNLAITRYHHSKRELVFARNHWCRWEQTIASPEVGAHERLQERHALEELARAFQTLTARERQCLILRSQGATFREASEALGITMRATVYSTGAALQKLHRELHVAEL